jgi:hypothetical protein
MAVAHWTDLLMILLTELKTLLLESKIMHRDIVPWNIFILREAKPPSERSARAFLVDFHTQLSCTDVTLSHGQDLSPVGTLLDIVWFLLTIYCGVALPYF